MFHIVDTGHPWVREVEAALRIRGTPYRVVSRLADCGEGAVFYPIVQYPAATRIEQQRAALRWPDQTFIQDMTQLAVYEDKVGQAKRFSKWMPPTSVVHYRDAALRVAEIAGYPLVSKSAEGSSSYNVRILPDKAAAEAEIAAVFGAGLPLKTRRMVQRGYWLTQEFIPHNVTWRITIVGRFIHVYKRFCYPDKAVAAPASVVPTEPAEMNAETTSLVSWAYTVFKDIGTKFCAIDALKTSDGWQLLETSLAWARGNDASANAPFFGSKHTLNTQFELMLDEVDAGVFGETPARKPRTAPEKTVVCWLWNDARYALPEVEAPKKGTIRLSWRQRALRRELQQAERRARQAPAVLSRTFEPEHVNALQRMVAKYLPENHRFVCIADSPDGLSPDVEWLKTPPAAAALAALQNPEGGRFPSCYRRLWLFSNEARALGKRVLTLDIDMVVLGDLAPLFAPQDDYVGWRPKFDWGGKKQLCGAMALITPGTRTQVWTDFRGAPSIVEARAAGFRGSDQAWISYKIAAGTPSWGPECGIYALSDLGPQGAPPPDARVVQFNGRHKPWHFKSGWQADNWREHAEPASMPTITRGFT